LLAAYIVSNKGNAIAWWPEESAKVAISFLVPILWPGFHVFLFEKFSQGSLGLLCTAQDVVMIIALLYFPAVCGSSLTDTGYAVAALVSAYFVA